MSWPALVLALNAGVLVVMARYVFKVRSGAPAIWERQIRRFEKADRQSFPRAGGMIRAADATSTREIVLIQNFADEARRLTGR